MIAILLVFAPIFIVLLLFLHQKWKYRSISHIPGPTPLPLFGNVLEFGTNTVEKLKDLSRLSDIHGDKVKIHIGPISCHILNSDPELTEFLISSPKYLKKSKDYELFGPWIQNGLLTSTGSYWQKRRKAITPTFHFKILENFIPVFFENSKILIRKLYEATDKDIDIYPLITAYALDVICDTAMGTNVKAQEDPSNNYVQAVKSLCNILMIRSFSVWKQFDFLFPFASEYKEQQEGLKIIHGFTNSVIQKKRKELLANRSDKGTNKQTEDEGMGIKKKMAFLDLLLNVTIDGKPLSDSDIREEVDTFMFEGHDTTSSAICFCIYELSRNPKVQEKLLNEIETVFGDDRNREPTIPELNNLKYLELVIKETLRLYPSVPVFGREITEDANYKGTVFPKGTAIMFFDYYMHRRPDLFPNPTEFYPERFLPENNKETRNPFAYIPFSAGPRNCIGQKFAMYELKCIIMKIVHNFEILPAKSIPELILSFEVILKSANGVHVYLKSRKF